MSNWITIEQNLKDLSSELKYKLENLRLYSCINTSEIFQELDAEGKSCQSKLREDYFHYFELLRILFVKHPKSTNKDLKRFHDDILKPINREGFTPFDGSCNEVFSVASDALDHQIGLLDEALKVEKHRFTFVPDTNALIYNNNLSKWIFEGAEKFYILLLPTVLSELDALKINHRNENVRNKSNSLIRQLKDYRRRGKLNDGVPIVKEKIYIQSKAIEPDFDNSLSWLDSENNDDRIIAGFLEVMRQQTNSTIVLVTSDINLQNKAEFACLPFTEPPPLGNKS